jgi:hypothetical protein
MAISAEELNIILQVRDQQMIRALKQNERRIQQFSKKTNTNLGKSTKAFKALAASAVALTPILAGTFGVQAIRGAARQAKEIQNLSNLAGVTAEEFQKLSVAADTVGFSQEKVADIFKDVNDKFGDFMATGAGPLKDFFENIAPLVGVTAEQFANLSGPQALQLYVESLERAGVSQQQMTFYMEALANDATNLIPLLKNGGEEMRRLGDEAQRAGRILGNDAVEAGARLDTKMEELTDTLRTKLQQAVLDNADEITDFADKAVPVMIGGMAAIGDTATTVASHVAGLAGEIAELAAEAASFYDQAVTWADSMGLTLESMFGGGAANSNLARVLRGEVPANDPRASGRGNGIDLVRSRSNDRTTPDQALFGTTTGTPLGAGGLLLPPSGRTVPSVRSDTSAGGGRSGGGGGSSAAERDDILADLIQEIALNEQLLGVSGAREDVMRRLGNEAANYSETEINGVIARVEAYEAEKASLEEIQQRQQAIAQTIESEMTNAFTSIIDGTKTAKEAFADMARAVISELMRVLVVQQMVGSFDATSGKGSGIVGAIMGAFSGRASGGSVMAGQAYRVGEHGPEPFIPAQNGRILSVAQAKSAMGGGQGGQNVTQHIHVTTGVQQTVRAEIKSLMPQITEAAVAATRADKMRRVS